MKSVFVNRWLLVPLFLFVAFPVFAKPPQAVGTCPFTIDQPGKYRLTNDLVNCDGFGVAIHASDVTLDLKGHTISCENTGSLSAGVEAGMAVPVHGVKITNGTVTGCAGGILLGFAEDSSVTKVTASGNYYVDSEACSGLGIFVLGGGNNVIMHNTTYDNEKYGISSLWSSSNLYKHNTSHNNRGIDGGFGISLDEDSNSQVLCNRVYGNPDGIYLGPGSNDNLLRGNLVVDNSFSGIGMMGLAWNGFEFFSVDIPGGNLVRSNIVEGNGVYDLVEFHLELATWEFLLHPEGKCMNTWVKNQFGPDTRGPDGCFGTPVMLDDDDVCALDDDD